MNAWGSINCKYIIQYRESVLTPGDTLSARMKPDHVPGQQIPSLGHHSPTTLWLLHNRFRAVRPLRFADLERKRRVYAKQTAVSQTARDLSLTLDSCESRRGLHRVIQDTGSDYRASINRVPIHTSPNCKKVKDRFRRVVRNFMFPLTSPVDV